MSYYWELLLIKPIFNFLVFTNFYVGNLGIAILILTVVIKTLLIPLNIPTIKMQSKKKVMDEELKVLKEKYKDKNDLAKAQMELYKKHGVNPASGCLPLIVQIFVFFALYAVLRDLLTGHISESLYYLDYLKDAKLNTFFIYIDLAKPDKFYILPFLAGISQFFMTKLTMPKVDKKLKDAEKTKSTSDDLMYNMQEQMLYVSPVMTFIFGLTLPSGLALYWFVSTIFSVFQTLLINKFYKN